MATGEKILESIPFRFKISGNLIKKLGEESISNKNIAILELIKNAYDANASKVEIRLENINTNNASIIISDNGDGMTSTDLENKWLNIATPNKTQLTVETGGRIPVGEKGIGRLSSESLGDQTILLTKPKGETNGYKIVFDWTKYKDTNALANEIINAGGRFKKKKKEFGTQLEIVKLRHNWNDSEVQDSLLKDIYLLHPPTSKPKKFTVVTSFSSQSLKRIDKQFLDGAAYKMKVSLTKGDILKYEVFAINGNPQKGQVKLDKKLSCGDASFEFYYYYRNITALKGALGYELSTQRIKESNTFLDEYGGIKIYRDGFRVKPYGEPTNDWLNLDIGFQNNSMYPRNSNVFGFVSISKLKNPNIADTTTREGIVYSDEFQHLIAFVKTSVEKIFVDFRRNSESHKKKASGGKAGNKKKKPKMIIVSLPQKSISISSERLIDKIGGEYPQNFYAQLELEINECYRNNFPNAAFFLSRKLIENLLFNILEKKYRSDVSLWYNTTTNNHLKMSLLISNLYNKKSDFKPNVKQYIEKVNTEIGAFRKETNSKAHNIFEYLRDKSELKTFKISDLAQLLLNIYHHM